MRNTGSHFTPSFISIPIDYGLSQGDCKSVQYKYYMWSHLQAACLEFKNRQASEMFLQLFTIHLTWQWMENGKGIL